MPLNSNAHLVEYPLDLQARGPKMIRTQFDARSIKAQEVQDQIFRKMSAEKKLKLMSQFYHFARLLHTSKPHGTRKTPSGY